MIHRFASRSESGPGLLVRVAAVACLALALSTTFPGRAAADENEVIEQILRFLRCTIDSGPFGFMGVFCTWH